ncbi:DUF397 domain-containing protein [Streptomyces sp. NPDC004111]|uniref:DUF397 domain-containing protein n=1 Tax=Streptomyces sp. NPDC004111 TaxID=3364690 RepID=UPI0036A207E8
MPDAPRTAHHDGRPPWRKSTYSDSTGNNCVEVRIETHVSVRDSKDASRPNVTTSAASWTAFIHAIAQ